jgi:hypothetical protein
MSTRRLSSYVLKNGLQLECLDHSKQIAADRWYVCVWVHIHIPVEKKWFVGHHIDEGKFQELHHALGKVVIFKQKNERNFVSDDQKESIVQEICDRVAQMGMKYFSHDDFAAKYLLKCFEDRRNRR